MTTKQAIVKKDLFHKSSVLLFSGGLFIATCFFLIVMMLKLAGLSIPSAAYIPGFLAVFMMSVGFLLLVKYKSLINETGQRHDAKQRLAGNGFFNHFLRTQIIFGLALIAILHSVTAIIIGLVIIFLAAYFIFLRK